MAFIYSLHINMLFNDITSFISNAHIFQFFSPSFLSSCFVNHLMEMLILQLGLFLLHVHSSSWCPFWNFECSKRFEEWHHPFSWYEFGKNFCSRRDSNRGPHPRYKNWRLRPLSMPTTFYQVNKRRKRNSLKKCNK